ncbi:MarR family winged helix-turn-helix transcriptional regulator [Frankia sp. R82]|uniref:MarR family winged helix-turn-helix transcriptional regulator n=1 Tax=Frankia sp. R82 TaxID=2950553 RepID=UPI0020431A4C|nr:MarR family winged helix-turn-helix transcriptional regulator [Frankia sp. R82]MCM3882320.1 MarR family winged helix-turn-helix transcriptional regulator [Frankia sp. R82]
MTATPGSTNSRDLASSGDPGALLGDAGTLVLLTRLSRRVYRAAGDGVLGMTMKAFLLLNHVREESGVPQRWLSDALCIDANNTVLLLNEAERAGWVERRRDPVDRRHHLVQRTVEGTKALRAAEHAMGGVQDAVLDRLTLTQRRLLHDLLCAALIDHEGPVA